MANSDIVSSLKNKVIDTIIEDETFFEIIDPNKEVRDNFGEYVESPEDMRDTYIFRFNRNPETIHDVITFLTVTVDLNYRDRSKFYTTPTLVIWIYSHNDHMHFTTEQRQKLFTCIDEESGDIIRSKFYYDNRNDYLATLIDKKFNGQVAGLGELKLVSNTEGQAGQTFLYRRLVFETLDISDSLCDKDGDCCQ